MKIDTLKLQRRPPQDAVTEKTYHQVGFSTDQRFVGLITGINDFDTGESPPQLLHTCVVKAMPSIGEQRATIH